MGNREPVIYTPRTPESWAFDLGEGKLIELSGDLIPPMTQEKSAGYVSREGFRACSLRDFFKLGGRMYELKNESGEIGEHVKLAQKFIIDSLRKGVLNTQTRVVCLPNGQQDKVVHDYGRDSVIQENLDLVGCDGEIEQVLSLEASLALTGKKPEKVAEIMSYLNNGTPVYIFKLKRKPESRDERVVGLGAYSGGFYLDCGRFPRFAYASFGVRIGQKNLMEEEQ